MGHALCWNVTQFAIPLKGDVLSSISIRAMVPRDTSSTGQTEERCDNPTSPRIHRGIGEGQNI
jgi:hypothetical protein